ncbi:MAG: hydroxymethylglutaryl-CoA lyase, partial [Pseudomonadota bacterium]
MDHCTITEVGLRDGLQGVADFLPTAKKIDIANRVIAAGMPRIEATSFVSPKAVPQLADAEDMIAGLKRTDGLVIEALAPNERGGKRAASAGVDVWVAFLSASEKHSIANSNASIAESFDRIKPLVALASENNATVAAAIAVAFD